MKERIKQIRSKLNMNQGEFARAVNIVQQQLSKYERGENKPSSEFLTVLVDKFNVNINWLLTGKGGIFATESSEKMSETDELFFIDDTNKTKSMYIDSRLISNVWHLKAENLKLVLMPDNSFDFCGNDFRAKKDDILLSDTSFSCFDFGVYIYKADGRYFVGSFTPLIDGSFLVSFGQKSEIVYTKEMLKNAKVEIVGKVVKNLSYINRQI